MRRDRSGRTGRRDLDGVAAAEDGREFLRFGVEKLEDPRPQVLQSRIRSESFILRQSFSHTSICIIDR